MAGRAIYRGAKRVDRANPGYTPNTTKPRGDIGHKGDGIRIPTTKGHESAKPQSEIDLTSHLGLAVSRSRFPSTNHKSLRQ